MLGFAGDAATAGWAGVAGFSHTMCVSGARPLAPEEMCSA